MSSRRVMTRSYSGDGRSNHYNGDDVSGSSRAGGRSYLSNVRPENRSTLCSVMAQLTEETQPSFEKTLKSRSVSETCNMKFVCMVTGHPTPEVTWYKDDMQLDRYCGLPKYEIFRNGQNHSLHIYNCTVEDAAIYQASASNNRGIVSCSGVLEVGEMNEFKIHQRYFAKLKQKAEHKRRELEGKENQGPELQEQLRTISPDRSQRKRRSPMEALLSTPSSTEDEGMEDSQKVAAAGTEARLQEATMKEEEMKPVPITNGALSPITNGNAINENGSTYIYDSAQKIFTSAHQPKAPFIKKKIKISNGAMSVKVEAPAERGCDERRAHEEASVTLAPTQPLQSQRTEEVMEVESTVTSSALDSHSRKVTEQHHKSAIEGALPVNVMPSEEVTISVEGNVPSRKEQPTVPIAAATLPSTSQTVSGPKGNQDADLDKEVGSKDTLKGLKKLNPLQKEQPTVPISAAPLQSTNQTVAGPKGKQAADLDKEVGSKDTFKNTKKQNPSPLVTPTDLQSSIAVTPQQPLSTVKDKTTTKPQQEDVTVMEVDEKSPATEAVCLHPSTASTDATSAHRGLESVDVLTESQDASPLRASCERSTDELSEKETSPSLKNAPVSRSEVTQAHTQKNRNDAPVNLKPRPTQCTMDAQSPQKSPSGRETMTDDNQAPSLPSPAQAAFGKMTQDTSDHSRGSNESQTVLFTELQKSPLESPGDGKNTPGCHVSPTVQQSQVEEAIKTVDGTEIQVDKKVKGNEIGTLLVQADNVATNECMVQMETEIIEVKTLEQAKTEEPMGKNCDIKIVEISETKNEPVLKRPEEKHSESQNLKPTNLEIIIPHVTKTPSIQNTNLPEQQINDFKEIPIPVPKVISIAELLRSIKALQSTVINTVTALPIPADQHPTTAATENCQVLRDDDTECKLEVKKSKLDKNMNVDGPDANIKATHLEVCHRLTKTDHKQIQSINPISPTVVIPAISVADTSTLESTKPSSTEKYNDSGHKSGASTFAPLKHDPVVSLSGTDNVQIDVLPVTQKQEVTNIVTPRSNPSMITAPGPGEPLMEKNSALSPSTNANSQDSIMLILKHNNEENCHGKDIELKQNVTPEIQLISDSHLSREIYPATLDQHKEHKAIVGGLQSIQTTKTERQAIHLQHNHQEGSLSMLDESSTADFVAPPNPEASPSLRKRNSAAPIPSATPQELASGARRKIVVPKAQTEDSETTSPAENQAQKEDVSTESSKLSPGPAALSVSPGLSRRSPLLQPNGGRTCPTEKISPLLSRRKMPLETPAPSQQPTQQTHTPKTEKKPAEKDKYDPFKAPQVIRKIRGESFSDASGHLKLWCQFFNVLSDSTIKWYRDEVEIAQIKRNAGDETQVNLAIVQASSRDCGVYGCTITNEHGTDLTDFLLSADILAGISLREDLGVGEEIEMTPLILNKGVADSGVWGNKFFGRIMMQESHIGDGSSHKVWRAKVIYGLEPVFESGNTCVIKVRNPIPYGGKGESCLIERNLDTTKKECGLQNLAREYCKIFSAEARVLEHFGPCLEVIPVYLMYRPANTVPHATVEADLKGDYLKYSLLDHTGRLVMRTGSEVEKKCCALQHWIHQWTNGNLLLTQLEGVDTKITNVGISVKSTGYQGLSVTGDPKVFEQFVSQHQCNYYCGLLGLRSLKVMDSLMTPSKPKGTRSPLLQRKMAAGSSSPQTGRKSAGSPRLPRKAESEQDGSKTPTKQKSC